MSAPSLDQLKELPLPPPATSYWPQTWGWLVLAGLALIALLAWAGCHYWRWRRDRYRREALIHLQELEQALTVPQQRLAALRGLPELLKRVALSAPHGDAAASLGGQAWQAFLERSSEGLLPADFSQQMATLAYAPDAQLRALPDHQLRQLLASSRHWIEKHHVAV